MPTRIHLLSCIKDEGPFLLEWVAHHRVIGFTKILIASNDCSDGSNQLLEALAAVGAITHHRNIVPPGAFPQDHAYQQLYSCDFVQRADWFMVLDNDEFLNVHIGDGTVQTLIRCLSADVDVVALNWRIFGDSFHETWQEVPVTQRFLWAAQPRFPLQRQIKSLIKAPARFRIFGNHRPRLFRADRPVYVINAEGRRLSEFGSKMNRNRTALESDNMSFAWAQVNHYAVKTRDSYRLKQLRGRGTGRGNRHTTEFFGQFNQNEVIDLSIRRYHKVVEEEMTRLGALPEVAQAQKVIMEKYRERLKEADHTPSIERSPLTRQVRIYVIDMGRNTNNWLHWEQAKTKGIEVIWVRAVDAKRDAISAHDLTLFSGCNSYRRDDPINRLIGCNLSHLLLWEWTLTHTTVPYIVVAEGDAMLESKAGYKITRTISMLNRKYPGWAAVWFAYEGEDADFSDRPLPLHSYMQNGAGIKLYAISRKGMMCAVRRIRAHGFRHAIDWELIDICAGDCFARIDDRFVKLILPPTIERGRSA